MMATKRQAGEPEPDLEDDEDAIEESIEVSGVPLVVWSARLTLILFFQGLIVLGSYAFYGFDTDPAHFGPGFRLDPIHAAVNLVWGLAGSVIGFFMPRLSISYMLAFAIFFTLFAGFGTFTPDHLGMRLDMIDNLINWGLALAGWGIAIYALWQACLHAEGDC
jgi:hypothetical protein